MQTNRHVKKNLPTLTAGWVAVSAVAFVVVWALAAWLIMLLVGVVHSFLAIGTLGYFQTWVAMHLIQMLVYGPVSIYSTLE